MGQDETENLQKVLLADDNAQIRMLVKKFFIKAKKRGDINCEVLEVSDGKQAIEVLEQEKPDLILCDINMPKLSGYGVLNYFNKTERTSRPFCFFAFLTSSTDEMQNAFSQNVMGFLDKNSMSYVVLSHHIKTWLRLAKLERIQARITAELTED